MSVQDMQPQGWDESFRFYASRSRPVRTYTQGSAAGGNVTIWLTIDGMQTAIGYGPPQDAVIEASTRLYELIKELEQGCAGYCKAAITSVPAGPPAGRTKKRRKNSTCHPDKPEYCGGYCEDCFGG